MPTGLWPLTRYRHLARDPRPQARRLPPRENASEDLTALFLVIASQPPNVRDYCLRTQMHLGSCSVGRTSKNEITSRQALEPGELELKFGDRGANGVALDESVAAGLEPAELARGGESRTHG